MKPLNEQINPKFVKQAQVLSQYAHLIQICLPVETFKHVNVANIRDGSLVLVTDSPVWSTRLRHMIPQMLQTIRDNSLHLSGIQPVHQIQIKTRYQAQPAAGNKHGSELKKHQRRASLSTTRLLASSASAVSDEKLKKSLLKLSETLKKQAAEKSEEY
jgi:hypothetical protein